MNHIALGSTFEEFPNNQNSFFRNMAGSGASCTLNSAKTLVRCTAPAGTYANYSRQIYLRPGQELVAEVVAWAVSGEGGLGFDVKNGPNARSAISWEKITSTAPQNYIIRHKANLFKPEVVNLWCGVITTPDGDIFMRMPRVRVENYDFPTLRVIASAMLQVSGGAGASAATFAVEPSFPTFGVAGVTAVSATAFDIELAEPLADIYGDGNLDDVRGAKPFFTVEPQGFRRVPTQAKVNAWLDSDSTPKRNKLTVQVMNCVTAVDLDTAANLVDWDAYTGTEYFRLLAYML